MTTGPVTTAQVEAKGDGAATVAGETAPGFEPVRAELARLLAAEADCSGQLCAYVGGRKVVDLWGGVDVGPDDLVGVFSSTKGVSAIAIAVLVQRGQMELDAPVSRYWPEFAAAGKGAVTVRLALSHQAGLVGVEPQLSSLTDFLDHATVAAASPLNSRNGILAPLAVTTPTASGPSWTSFAGALPAFRSRSSFVRKSLTPVPSTSLLPHPRKQSRV